LKSKKGQEQKEMTEEEVSLKTILVPLDGSEPSFRAAKYAIKIAKMASANIICVHMVVKLPSYSAYTTPALITEYIADAKRDAEKWYDGINSIAAKVGVNTTAETILDVTSVADSIIKYAREHNADLIIMGTKGRTGLAKFMLGSVANGVVSHASCPVLVVR
jgi:nucleotide-binding universal stress UspA family protein